MKTIVITSQKGGSGKTTLAAHLAVEAERTGDGPVYLIDTDKQGTLTKWHGKREADSPQRADFPFHRLGHGLSLLAERGAGYCIIDTPPTISEQTAATIDLADLVLIPTRPSPADLWAVAETLSYVQASGKPFLFVLTQAKANALLTAQTSAALSKHGRVAEAFIHDRVPYAAAMTDGRTAPELALKGKAAQEIADLWIMLKECFHENLKTGKRVVNG